MSRYSDGEFQINSIENAFMKQLKAFYKLKSFPISRMDEQVEFSPIDCVAETIVRLSETNDKFTVFLSCNNHYVQMGDVIYAMNRLGSEIAVVNDKDFDDRLMKLMSDDKRMMQCLFSYRIIRLAIRRQLNYHTIANIRLKLFIELNTSGL